MSSLIGPRIAAMFAVAFAVLLFLGVASLSVPRSASDQAMVDWWSDGGNQNAAIISMYFVVFSALALILFLSHLRERLNENGGSAGNAMFAVGSGAFVLLLASAAMRAVIATALKNDEPLPGVDTLRYFPQVAYGLMGVALIAMATSLVLLFLAVRKTSAFPAWLGYASLVAGILLLVGTPVVGPFMIPVVLLWAIAAAVAAWRSASAESDANLQVTAFSV